MVRPGLRGPHSALAAEAHRIPTRFSSATRAQGRAALAGTCGPTRLLAGVHPKLPQLAPVAQGAEEPRAVSVPSLGRREAGGCCLPA